MTTGPQPDNRWGRSFIAGVGSAVFQRAGIGIANDSTVLSLFINEAGGSNTLVGLTPMISAVLTRVPQLFVSGRLEGTKRKMPYFVWPRAARGLMYLLVLVPSMVLAGAARPRFLLAVFFLTFSMSRLFIGFSQVARMEIVAKAIPARYLSVFWGQRNLWGRVAAFGASIVVGLVLNERIGLVFPFNYAVLFGLGSVFLLMEAFSFSLIPEPVDPGDAKVSGIGAQLRRVPEILRGDRNYTRYVIGRLLLSFARVGAPFYILYAKEVLKAPVSLVGIYLPVLTLSSILSNIVWGNVAYRRGNKFLLEASVIGEAAVPAIAIGLPFILTRLGAGPSTIMYSFALVFFVRGIASTATQIGSASYLLLVSPRERRPTYIGLNQSIMGLAGLLPAVGGSVADALGYGVVFAIVAGVVAVALVPIRLLDEAE